MTALENLQRETTPGSRLRVTVLFTTCLAGMGKGQEGGAGKPQMGWQRGNGRVPKRSWVAAMNGGRSWQAGRQEVVCQKFNEPI